MTARLALEEYVEGVRAGDRVLLARAITLVESAREDDRALAIELVERLLPATGGAIRLGVSGAPGVGKSSLLEALGTRLVDAGQRLAVLAVDPSSRVSGGSILGDKSRMHRLAQDPRAFIRPSPAGATLGGVARRTRESMLLCEAAGFEVVIVETVGVGQSEAMVAEMVDTLLLLLEPGAGDELQGIKRGLIELADLIAITKADGDRIERARHSRREFAAALRYLAPSPGEWTPRVTIVSALTGEGLDELWAAVRAHRESLAGALEGRRREQLVRWMWSEIEHGTLDRLRADPRLAALEAEVRSGGRAPSAAAAEALALLRGGACS